MAGDAADAMHGTPRGRWDEARPSHPLTATPRSRANHLLGGIGRRRVRAAADARDEAHRARQNSQPPPLPDQRLTLPGRDKSPEATLNTSTTHSSGSCTLALTDRKSVV